VTQKERRVRVARGEWLVPHVGVLVVAGAPPTWKQELMVATLATNGVICGRAAVVLHGLDGVRGEPREPLAGRGTHARFRGFIVRRTTLLEREDVCLVDGIPTTTVARTLCDLGAIVDDDTVEQLLDDVLRKGFRVRWITETLDRVDRAGPERPRFAECLRGRTEPGAPLAVGSRGSSNERSQGQACPGPSVSILFTTRTGH
jgi:hypothetical protein